MSDYDKNRAVGKTPQGREFIRKFQEALLKQSMPKTAEAQKEEEEEKKRKRMREMGGE